MGNNIIKRNLIYNQNCFEQHRLYWQQVVSNGISSADLPFRVKDKTSQNIQQIDKCFLTSETSNYIRKISQNSPINIFTVMISVFKMMQYKYSRMDTNSFTYLSPSIINTTNIDYVILQSDINQKETLKQVIMSTAKSVVNAYEYQNYPLSMIDERFDEANFNVTNLINVGFSLDGLHNDFKDSSRPNLHFHFSVTFNDIFEVTLKADENFIDKTDANFLLQNYVSLLNRIEDITDQSICDIQLLDDENLNYIHSLFAVSPLKAKTVKEQFENMVTVYGDKTAVVFENNSLTYNQLNNYANSLADDLKKRCIRNSDKVLILMEMSTDVLVGMLAAIKIGIPYIPLDVDVPLERLKYIIEDSGARFAIINEKHQDLISNFSIEVFNVEDYRQDKQFDNPTDLFDSNNPIYIIYTSGTTGKPKGVVVNHRNVINYVNWFTAFANVNELDKSMLVSSFSFDLGYTSIYSSILNGAELHLLNKDQYSNISYIMGYIEKNGITFFKLTPSLFALLKTDSRFGQYDLSSLRLIILGGEKLRIDDVHNFKQHYKNCAFVNHYGPTETTIGTIAKYISEDEYSKFEKQSILGKPITNNEVYIISPNNEPVPIGILGEIVIGGLGVSDGYLNRKELTEEKFVTLPKVSKSILYKTGDLGRLLPTGEIEFFGRIDNQVKIRGYRVEIGEIEQCIKKFEGISDVVLTTFNKNGSISLAAYYISEKEISINSLREYLSSQLPDYMIPTYFTPIDKIPVTLNGKIDFKALPEPVINLSDRELILPRNEIEQQLMTVWKDALGINEDISIDDNFFDLGGDSILAIQISSSVKSAGLNIEVKDIMQNPTIRQLGTIAKENSQSNVIDQGPITGKVLLSPIQRRFFERLGAPNHWNQSITLKAKTLIDTETLDHAFSILMEKHDILRAAYTSSPNGYEQIIGTPQSRDSFYRFVSFNVDNNITGRVIEDIGNELQASLNIENGPMVILSCVQNKIEQYIIIIAHHLVVDGVSWRIIISQLDLICQGKTENLPTKTNSYRDWVNWLNESTSVFKEDLKYWNSIPNIPEITDNHPMQNGLYKDVQTEIVTIDENITQSVLSTANRAYNTKVDDLLLAAFLISLRDTINLSRVVVNLEGHGRETFGSEIDISRTIGWFTCVYPFFFSFEGITTLEQTIKHVKEGLRHVPHNGLSYSVLRYMSECDINKIDSSICFNYLGQFDSSFDTTCFKYSDYQAGQTIGNNVNQQYGLHLNLYVIKGKIQINATYSTKKFSIDTIKDVLNNFKSQLEEISDMCMSVEETRPTPSDYPFVNISIDELDDLINKYKTEDGKSNIENIYPLTPFQEVMYHESNTYNKAIQPYYHNRIFDINAPINIQQLQSAIDIVVKKYEALRMAIEDTSNGQHITIVLKDSPLKVVSEDISKMTEQEQEQYFEAFRLSDTLNSYTKNYFMRIFLFKLNDSKYRILWSNSHLMIDGWSRMIILKDFLEIFQKLKANQPIEEKASKSFYEYVKWLYNKDYTESKQYWDAYMEGYKCKKVFGTVPQISDGVYFLRQGNLVIDEEKSNLLNEIARSNNITIGVILQCAIGLVLQQVCNSDDITFGGVVSGRSTDVEDVENMVGPFINIIPFRVKVNTTTFLELVKQRHNDSLEAEKHSYIYYKDPTLLSDFCALVAFENYPIDDTVRNTFLSGGLVSNLKLLDRVGTNVVFLVFPDKSISFTLACNPKLISSNQQNEIMQRLNNIIELILDSKGTFNLSELIKK